MGLWRGWADMIKFAMEHLLTGKLESRRSNDEGRHIAATLVCGDSRATLFGLTYRVSITEMFVNLVSSGGTFPYTYWLNGSTPSVRPLKAENSEEAEKSTSEKLEAGINISTNSSLNASAAFTKLDAEKFSNNITYEINVQRFTPRGSEKAPSWKISLLPGEYSLQGMILANENLCKYYGSNVDSIEISIEAPRTGISSYKEIWNPNKNSNKQSIIGILVSRHVRSELEGQTIKMSAQDE
jgi:hypothetical protein